jgi:dTDP-4-dehydrorhamnose reductase
MSLPRICVVGGSGMIASRFVDLAKDKFEIVSVDEKTVDITDAAAVEKYFGENEFDSILNFSAFTNVDAAEAQRGDEEGLVWRLNVEGVKNLIKESKKSNIFLIQISTDFVFPGTPKDPGPYVEDAQLPKNLDSSISWYGWTKAQAEKEITSVSIDAAILRLSYPFRAAEYKIKLDWARNLLKLFDEHKLYPLFTDQVQSVLLVDDLLIPLSKIIDLSLSGIFHVVSSDTTSPYEIGLYLLEKYANKRVDVPKGLMTEFLKTSGRAPRPVLGGLNTSKTEDTLEMHFRSWREMIDDFLNQLRS